MTLRSDNPESQRRLSNKVYFDKNIRSLSDRQIRWIQSYLSTNINIGFSHAGSTDRHEELIRQLCRYENFRDLVEESYSKISSDFVPERYFEWLVDNLRGQIFTLNILYLEHNYYSFDRSSYDLTGNIYIYFDSKLNTTHINFKIDLINNIEERWRTVSDKDNYSNWLNKNSEEQIEWTKDYLKKDGKYNSLIRDRVSLEETRGTILASLDLIDLPVFNESKNSYISHISTDRKERIIDKMKRAWSQQKYRDAGKTKKLYHLPLTKMSKDRLDKMALVQDTTSTAILDMLINSAYEADYIDGHGKDIY